jgi:hypothetical protein
LLLSMCAWIAPRLPAPRNRELLIGAIALALLLYFGLIISGEFVRLVRAYDLAPIVPAVGIIALYLATDLVRLKQASVALTIVGLAFLNMTLVRGQRYSPSACRYSADAYEFMTKASISLSSRVSNPEKVYVWFQEGEPMPETPCTRGQKASDVGYSFTSIGHSYVETPFPMKPIEGLSSERLREIGRKDALVVAVTYDEAGVGKLIDRFKAEGITLKYDGVIRPSPTQTLPPIYVLEVL